MEGTQIAWLATLDNRYDGRRGSQTLEIAAIRNPVRACWTAPSLVRPETGSPAVRRPSPIVR